MKDKRFKHPSIYIFDLLETVIEIWHFFTKDKTSGEFELAISTFIQCFLYVEIRFSGLEIAKKIQKKFAESHAKYFLKKNKHIFNGLIKSCFFPSSFSSFNFLIS